MQPRTATPSVPPSVTTPAATSAASVAQPPGAAHAAASAEAQEQPSDRGLALRTWVEQQSRLYRVAAPLLIKNTELCPRHARPILGFTAKNRYAYGSAFVAEAESALGLGEELRVMTVLPGSGAELAGLRQGDVLLAVEIEPLPQGPDAERHAAALIASEVDGRSSLRMAVLRDGERMALDIPLTHACAMVVEFGNTEHLGNYADGQRVMVTRGMLELAKSDEELAYELAREIARNVLMPASRPDISAVIARLNVVEGSSGFADGAADVLPAPEEPPGLDKLALYMLARAGYAIDAYAAFWNKVGARVQPVAAQGDLSSPVVAESGNTLISQSIRTIKEKQASGQALVPSE